MFLTRISVLHPVFATMMMLTLVVIGAFSFQKLGVDKFPKVDMPVVAVITTYPGASPETVEADVTKKIEEEINTISGLDELTSTTSEGRSVVIAQFKLEIDAKEAAQDVRDKVSAIEGRLPDGVDKPTIRRFNPTDRPIMSVAVSSEVVPLHHLTSFAEQTIVKRFNILSGVGQVDVVGGQDRQIKLNINRTKLESLGIGIDEVLTAVQSQNENFTAGSLKTIHQEFTLQVNGKIEQPIEFMDLVVARRGDMPIFLKDIATYEDGMAEASTRALLDGKPSLSLQVIKTQESNTVEVADYVKQAIAEMNEEFKTNGITLSVITDNSTEISESVEQVQSTLLEGALLATLIVFVFLNSWRSTVITGLTLPISIIGTLAFVYMMGFTLNMLTLLALTLSIGILIDDAIVVRENITRHLHMGKSHIRAALDGTNEIGLAVLATTCTIVAVFLPVAMMDGMVGRFFFQFGVTVSVAVLISLFVSFTLDPMLSSVWYDPDARHDAKRGPIGRAVLKFDALFDRVIAFYKKLVEWTLDHRLITIVATIAIFIGSVFMVRMVGVEFMPQADQGKLEVAIEGPIDSSLDYTTVKTKQVEQALREFPEVASTYSTINSGRSAGKNKATIEVLLVPFEDRDRSQDEMTIPFRERLDRIPGIKISVKQEGVGGRDKPLEVSLMGDDPAILAKLADEIISDLNKSEGIVEAETSTNDVKPMIGIKLKKEAASDLGVSLAQVGQLLKTLVNGEEVTTWTAPDGTSYDVVVQLPEDQRRGLSDVTSLMLATGQQEDDGTPVMVRLDQVADIVETKSPAEIERKSMSREVKVSANIDGITIGDATTKLKAILDSKKFPLGYSHSLGGDSKNMNDTVGPMITALAMAVLFIYIVLASQFGSFLQPLAIMVALPLSLIGVILGLMAWGSTFNMFSMIGFIMLMGLVTKNGILLVDFYNQERKRGTELKKALILAGTTRFRPIIMTTVAMICGMIPLAMVMAGGGAQRAPMAHAVIGGLISSTVLTLFVVPVMISYLDALGRFVSSYFAHPDHHDHEIAEERGDI